MQAMAAPRPSSSARRLGGAKRAGRAGSLMRDSSHSAVPSMPIWLAAWIRQRT